MSSILGPMPGSKKDKESIKIRKEKEAKKEEEYMSKFSDKYHKEQKKVQKRKSRRTKELTPAQKRFKEREAKGLSGLTGGKKGETMAEYRARQKKAVQDAARARNEKFQDKRKNKNKLKTNTSKRKSRYNSPNRGISSKRSRR